MGRIIPHLWYNKEAEEAARFYASILPNSHVDAITPLLTETPSGPAVIVEFTLMGSPFQALSAGPFDAFNHSFSLIVECENQAEIDKYWDALGAGGQIEQCGWLKDRYGVSWQIVPKGIEKIMRDPDKAMVKRYTEAMLKMVKLDIAELTRAVEGK